MSGRIVDYKILRSTGSGELRRIETLVILVNEAIAVGWEPLGGVAVYSDMSDTSFFQAIVKRESSLISN